MYETKTFTFFFFVFTTSPLDGDFKFAPDRLPPFFS